MFPGSFIQQHHLFLFTCVETSEDKCWSEQVCSGVGSNIRTQPQEAQTNRNYRTLNELQHMNTQRVDRHTEASRSYKHYTHTHTHTCSNFSLARKSTTTIKHCREEISGSGEQTGLCTLWGRGCPSPGHNTSTHNILQQRVSSGYRTQSWLNRKCTFSA